MLKETLEAQAAAIRQLNAGRSPNGWAHSSLYDYFVKNGRTLVSAKPSKAYRQYVWECVRYIKPEVKQCFANAQRLVSSYPEYTYWEGYVVVDKLPLPILHGWVTGQDNGKDVLIDPTLKFDFQKRYSLSNILIGPSSEREYFGVPFPTKEILDRMRQTLEYGSLVDDWKRGFPLLRGATV